jgi:TolA-binding protein
MDEILYLAAKAAMKLGQEDKAASYVARLRDKYRGSDYRLDADMDIAEIYLEQGEYDKCIEVYEGLTRNRLAQHNRFRVWSSLARAYIEVGRPEDALNALGGVDKVMLGNEEKAEAMLLRGEANVGVGNTDTAILAYKNVTARFPKSKFSAEAYYRLGGIYQQMDSLEVAKTQYESVTRAYPGSEFADQSIKNSSNISQLIRLRASEGEESPEAHALRVFSLAEVQLFQFKDTEKALEGYNQVLSDYSESEFAPKAAYAVAYIHGEMLGQPDEARDLYQKLIRDYPDSQQADIARELLGLPPVQRAVVPPDTSTTAVDTTGTADESASIEGTDSP